LRSAPGTIEAEGIARARARAGAADLVLALFAADGPPDAETLAMIDDRTIRVTSKADLGGTVTEALAISTTTNAGIDTLLKVLTDRVAGLFADRGAPPPTRARHRQALTLCLAALDASGAAPLPELAAEELRIAADELGRITGRIDIEDMLDSVFRDFCIGK